MSKLLFLAAVAVACLFDSITNTVENRTNVSEIVTAQNAIIVFAQIKSNCRYTRVLFIKYIVGIPGNTIILLHTRIACLRIPGERFIADHLFE